MLIPIDLIIIGCRGDRQDKQKASYQAKNPLHHHSHPPFQNLLDSFDKRMRIPLFHISQKPCYKRANGFGKFLI